jgi:hypothetical protein
MIAMLAILKCRFRKVEARVSRTRARLGTVSRMRRADSGALRWPPVSRFPGRLNLLRTLSKLTQRPEYADGIPLEEFFAKPMDHWVAA